MANVGNDGDSVAEGIIVVTVDDLPGIQSARRVVVEPAQHEQLDLFVPIPKSLGDRKSLKLTATMYVDYGNRQVILENQGKPARHSMTLKVGEGRTLALAMESDWSTNPAWYWPQASPQADYEFAIAARIESEYDRSAASFDQQPLPLNTSNWAGLDLFVVADPAVLEDGAVVAALQRYVSSGGRLWIMLDRVPCPLVRQLLGPTQICEEIERVELNDFVIEAIDSKLQLSESDRRVKSEPDLAMVRVVQEGGHVRFAIAGWPAAIEMNNGYGQIVLTTLDSRAWIEPRTKKISQDPLFLSTFQTRDWAKLFVIDLNKSRASLPLTEQVEYPLKLIGNPIVPREWVSAVLVGFFAFLIGAGLWFSRLGKLTAMGLVAPVSAITISIALITAANWIRRDIPESISRFQIIDVGADGGFATVREQAAVYLETSGSMQLTSPHDGSVQIDEAITSGVPRFVQNDFQDWTLTNDDWPPGSWRYEATATVPTKHLLVRGSFSKTGLHLDVPDSLPSPLEDPVLSFSPGDPMLCDITNSRLQANNVIKIESDRWIAGVFLSDEQQRRLELYRQFFQTDDKSIRPTRRLYGWTQPWNIASWNRELKQLGSALVALPVFLERPKVDTEILVPHGLISLRRDLAGAGITSIFDDRSGQWRKNNSSAAVAEMQFVLPPEVVPIAAAEIQLELDISAPQRQVSLSVTTPSGIVEIVKLDSPSIPWTATLTEPAILEAITGGTLNLLVSVSESRNKDSNGIASNMIHWEIDHLHASVRGRVLSRFSVPRPEP